MFMQGKQIYVKSVEESDVDALLKLEKDNRDFFQRFTGLREESFYTHQGQLERIRKAMEASKADQGYVYVIGLRDTGVIIGEIMLTEVVRGDLQSCWIGYFLDQDHNGKGYMTEAVQLVVRFAFQELKFHRIDAGVMPHNLASIQVLLKAGFHKEGIARKNVKINGTWEDHQTLAILNEADEQQPSSIQRYNPPVIAPPIGPYTHITKVPRGSELLVFSGQVGTDSEGNLPDDMKQQVENTLGNIERLLAAEAMSADHIVKINIWAAQEVDWDHFHQVWEKFHGGKAPAMTMAYVPALAMPSIQVEIEVWAAKG
ncbi:acetyltransferase [Paenibacillus sp. LC231]|uniref:GNAT family N-acetyltransferase n=1 Tax=Paenibacillus sp. LC231 TaxID=1120679 RepID=UPI0008DE8EF2|nr:GNAT family N-acetyltransferase [Paenibacillus sp. LC231]OIB00707.1 acetyltransferase [Paenibacillus sp. LC231]